MEKKKILLVSYGSRGDCQPFIAFLLGLNKHGFDTLFISNADNSAFASSMGINSRFVARDDKTPELLYFFRDAMNDGNLSKVKISRDIKHGDRQILDFVDALQQFSPDVVINGTMAEYELHYSINIAKIPTVKMGLQFTPLSSKRTFYGIPHMPFGLAKLVQKTFLSGLYHDVLKTDKRMSDNHSLGGTFKKLVSKKDWVNDSFGLAAGWSVTGFRLTAMSPQIAEVIYPTKPSSVIFTGSCCLDSRTQISSIKSGKESFFGPQALLDDIQAFIDADTSAKPVYIGWGSMIAISPAHMVKLAVRALMLSDQRAIIMGGCANLSLNLLEMEETSAGPELIAYAKEKVLFCEKAPHEWLFPKCSTLVHHGGAGTLNAGLRAGVPQIVTPVFFDQFDSALLVNKLDIGVGTAQFRKVSCKKLAEALTKIASDPFMRLRAHNFGAFEKNTSGVENAVWLLKNFVASEVETGCWRRTLDQLHARRV